jgi:uncharacterized protein (TIGR03118 family)
MHRIRRWAPLAGLAILSFAPNALRAGYLETKLVSDIPGLASHTDPNLRNPWGISNGPGSPFWVSDQAAGVSTLYNGLGVAQPLVVTIPTPPGRTNGAPTGQVFNPTSDFVLPTGGKALFLFASTNGTISGWNPASGTNAQLAVPAAGAIYTGLAMANNGTNQLYAANARGGIDVFDSGFNKVTVPGGFLDPSIPANLTPYNIQQIGGLLYVTYSQRGATGGAVNVFDTNGNLVRHISSGGTLNEPWGVTIAPASFGQFANDLLVGNFLDGRINAFDPTSGLFLGQLRDQNNNLFSEPGLWALTFGNGAAGSDPNVLYFTAGINNEVNGLFGTLNAVPEPSTGVLLGIGGALLVGIHRRRAKA